MIHSFKILTELFNCCEGLGKGKPQPCTFHANKLIVVRLLLSLSKGDKCAELYGIGLDLAVCVCKTLYKSILSVD